MINKKLIALCGSDINYVKRSVLFSLISQIFNVLVMYRFSLIIYKFYLNESMNIFDELFLVLALVFLKVLFTFLASRENQYASKNIKLNLRNKILDKTSKLKDSITKKGEILNFSVDGVDQLETYFSLFLPQFFYSMLSAILLFIVMSFFNLRIALTIFVFVPLIPIVIALVQILAKKLLEKYFKTYLGLTDNFYDNVNGLNTLKNFSADEYKHLEMNKEAKKFRIITMKVLKMQLNSIILMDVLAYGGTAIGIITSILLFKDQQIDLMLMMFVILISAEFFLPLRLLGSLFHVATNGISASKVIFEFLEKEEVSTGFYKIDKINIKFSDVSFSYGEKLVLNNLSFEIEPAKVIGIVGESGSGKSTLAKIVYGKLTNYKGIAKIGDSEINKIDYREFYKKISYVSSDTKLFNMSIRQNFKLVNNALTDKDILNVLKIVNLEDFVNEKTLDYVIEENSKNLSGGQIQRFVLARELLNESKILILDEATSNIDVKSEEIIMNTVKNLKDKTVIIITHRLKNVVDLEQILVLLHGNLVENDSHENLIKNSNTYSKMFFKQADLEKGGDESYE